MCILECLVRIEVRHFNTRKPTEQNVTMVRPNRSKCRRTKVSSSFTVQERLFQIRKGDVKKENIAALKKNEKEPEPTKHSPTACVQVLPNKKEKIVALNKSDEETKLPKFSSFPSAHVLPHKKLSITERSALISKRLKINVGETEQSEIVSKNVANNVVLNPAFYQYRVNKKSSDGIIFNVKKDSVDTEKANAIKNLEKFVEDKEISGFKEKYKKYELSNNNLLGYCCGTRNLPLLGDRLVLSKYSKSGSATNSNFTKQVENNPVIISDCTVPGTPSDKSRTSFISDLNFIEKKMKDLTINEAVDININDALDVNINGAPDIIIIDDLDININDDLDKRIQNQKRISSHRARLDFLKNFANEPKTSKKNPLKKLTSQQIRTFITSTSRHAISGIDKKGISSENTKVNDSEGIKLAREDLPSLSNDKYLKDRKSAPITNKVKKLKSELNNTIVNVPDIEKGSADCKHIKVESFSEIQHTLEKFPFPKATLHNYYALISEELKDKSLKIDPYYKLIHPSKQISEWTCMYHLKWPENCKVFAKGPTKKRASSFAAVKCLALLSEHGKISPDGLPCVYTKDEVHKVTQKKLPELKFDNSIIGKMQDIVDVFNNKMSPVINSVDYSKYNEQGNKIVDDEADPGSLFMANKPVYLGLHEYLAKEKVVLPISEFKELFVDLIQNNNCVIVKGEPGCGKSSRVPQYVLEAWVREASSENDFCRIAVTQPRRIAAISLAERVASERNEQLGRIVGYQVRLKSDFHTKTGRILYCTTGILLRHIQNDPNLTKFSHVILDEAHERDVNTDLLMNLLKRAIDLNDNLKVVVMSATIDADKFSRYFEGSPIFNVPGFAYPVTKHYLDGCKLDVSKTLKMSEGEQPRVIHEDVAEILRYIHKNKPEGAILTFLPGWQDLIKVQKLIPYQGDVLVHLVHSKLKDSEQRKIFARPPPGVRKIILATNIAETSITIDDVVYVVDTGLHKDQFFDNDKGINVIDMEWISKASANQRAGRAGRCSPGESFHLYTKERFSKFSDYSAPKILNSSLTKVVLDSKMYTNNMDACDFMNSLITPPEEVAVKRAVNELKQLELLDESEKLTPLGRTLVNFQLEPNLAKVMVNAVVFKCATPIVDIVTLFSSDTGIFGSLELTDNDHIKNVKSGFCKSSDHLALMRVYEKWLELSEEEGFQRANRFCRETNLVPHKLEFVSKLKDIHFGYLHNGLHESLPISEDFSDNDELVKAVIYSGTGTVLEHRNWDIVKNRLKTNVSVLVTRNNQKATITSESVNYKRHKFPSNFLVYINETRSNIRRTTIVRECSLIPPVSVLLFSNKKLEILEVNPKLHNVIDNMVIIGIRNTKQQFVCDKAQANILIDCKQAIDASYKYLIHQLTYAGEDIPEFLEDWNYILKNLSNILETYKID